MLRRIIHLQVFLLILQPVVSNTQQIDSLLNLLGSASDTALYSLYTEIANELYYDNQLSQSAEYYLKAANFELQKNEPSFRKLSESYGNTGYCYREMGLYEKAMDWYNLALKSATKGKDSSEISALYINIGNTQLLFGNFSNSIENFKNALTIDVLMRNQNNIANSYCNLGKVYDACGKHNEAIDFYKQALHIGRKIGDKPAVIVRLNNIGASFKALGKLDSAIYYFNESIILDSILNLSGDIDIPKANTVNQLAKGESYLYTELVSKVKTTDPRNEINKLYNEGFKYFHNGTLSKARDLFLKGYSISKKIGLSEGIIEHSKALSEVYSSIGDFRKAYQYQKIYSLLKDSILNIESIRSVEEFHVMYQTEKKQNEIKLLNKQKEIQALQLRQAKQRLYLFILVAILLFVLIGILFVQYRNKKKYSALLAEKNKNLKELNATKDRFFTIIAHDLKNPVLAFSNVTGALNDNIDNLSKDEVKYYLEQLNKSAGSILHMLKNLLDWAKIQRNTVTIQKSEFILYNIATIASDMVATSAKIKGISLKNSITEDLIIYAHQPSVTTILCNLLSNAIKFSPKGKEVTIGAEKVNGNINIFVEDKGIGMTEEDLKKLFRADVDTKTIGRSTEKGSGMGLIICKELVEKLGGEIIVESKVNTGTRFTFVLPHNA
jgi:signal transduction histidine kinase/Tfp pilus assembly protein PilF